jgi:hypothetical protein
MRAGILNFYPYAGTMTSRKGKLRKSRRGKNNCSSGGERVKKANFHHKETISGGRAVKILMTLA